MRRARIAAAGRGLAALVALAGFVVGVPVALVALGADPLAVRLPGLGHLRDMLLRSDRDGTVLLVALRTAAWVCWAGFTTAVVVEAAATITGRTARWLQAITILQQPAALLIATVTAALAAPNPLPAAAAQHVAATTVDGAVVHSEHAPGQSPPQALASPQPSQALTAPTSGLPQVTVGRYDSLWRIAHRHLGTGLRWAEIYRLNAGRPQPDGHALTDPDHIEQGWILELPADATGATPHDTGPTTRTVVVRPGDTLSGIAQRELGTPDAYPRIFTANAGRRQPDGRQLRDADHIRPGWILHVPSTVPTSRSNPRVPDQPVPASPTPSRPTPPEAPPAPPQPTPTSGTTAPPTRAPSPAPATGPTAHPQTPSATTTSPTPTGSASPTTPAQSTATAAPSTRPPDEPPSPGPSSSGRDHPSHQTGVDLPGGWIGLPLAAALLSAAGWVWLRRRHRHVPGPVATAVTDDPDLRPLPPAVTAMRRAVRDQPMPTKRPPPPTVAEYAAEQAATDTEPPPVGPSGPTLAGLTDPLPPEGLALAGPGAQAAARALLVAALSAGCPLDPDACGEAVIPVATLTSLLGAEAVRIGPIPRLRVAATLTDALSYLDGLLLERRRTLDENDATDVAELRTANPYHAPMPQILLITEPPDADCEPRLRTTLRLGAPLDINAIVLGETGDRDRLTVDEDGDTDGEGRLAVLDVPTSVQLLEVLREAHTGLTTPAGGTTTDHTASAAATHATATRATSSADTANGRQPTPAHNKSAPRARSDGPDVQVRLLGMPAILDPDGNPVTGLRHHATELLVYLAVHRAGANLPDIMEAFWPNAVVRRASQRLSTEVANLRRGIRHAAADQTLQPVINTGSRYHLNPDLLTIDIWTLDDALAQAAAGTDPDARTAALRRAVDAHTGVLAEGCDYDWIDQPREHYRRCGIRARIHLADLLAPTDPTAAADLTTAAADLDPYNEDLARRDMRARGALGDTAAVRARLHQLRAALEQIDEEPAAETTALAAQLTHDASAAAGPRGLSS